MVANQPVKCGFTARKLSQGQIKPLEKIEIFRPREVDVNSGDGFLNTLFNLTQPLTFILMILINNHQLILIPNKKENQYDLPGLSSMINGE